MSTRNIRRWIIATALIAPWLAQAWRPVACLAQTFPADALPWKDLTIAEQADRAFAHVRRLLNPETARVFTNEGLAFHLRDATAVCVILRHNGRVLGIGEDAHADDWMLLRATNMAREKMMDDPVIAGMSKDVRDGIGPALCIEIEAAGKMSPLIGRTIPQLSAKVEPGLEGFALRRNDQWFVLYPSQLCATNSADDLNGRMLGLALKSGLQAGELRDLSKKTDSTFYRFPSVHMVQINAETTPMQMYRGDVLVLADSINRQAVQNLASGIVSHLRASMWPDPPMDPTSPNTSTPARKPLGLMGDYRVVADDYRPLIAGPLEQALAAFALLRYAACPGVNEQSRQMALQCGTQILKELAETAGDEASVTTNPAVCAAIVYAVSQKPSLAQDATIARLFGRACESVKKSFDPAKNSFLQTTGQNAPTDLPPHAQAMVAGAMSRLLIMHEVEQIKSLSLEPDFVRAAIDRAWNSVFEPQRITLLPWIGWAEADYARAESQPLGHPSDVRKLTAALDKARIGPDALSRPLDLCGGFEFTADDGIHRPDSQTARPAAWLGFILRDPTLVPADRYPAALDQHLQTMRFLTQLTIRETAGYSVRNPTAAMGGVRQSLWNSQQPVAAQAMALLAVAETLETLERPTAEPAKP